MIIGTFWNWSKLHNKKIATVNLLHFYPRGPSFFAQNNVSSKKWKFSLMNTMDVYLILIFTLKLF